MIRKALALCVLLAACSSPGGTDTNEHRDLADSRTRADVGADLTLDGAGHGDLVDQELAEPDEMVFDFQPLDEKEEPQCEAGEGCFLDPCETNDDCLSGWCVGHMGEDVCTQQCQSECPPGWSCEQVPGTIPDVVWICVSAHANLCLPCETGADCKGAAGVDDVCVDYGDEGAFCGGSCTVDDDCPWGFSCVEAVTVSGVDTKQCVADAGVCPCTKKSVELALVTACEVTNEYGTCEGLRTCKQDGLTDCDADVPTEEVCDGLDNDCDGFVDEPKEAGGDFINLCNDDNACTKDTCDGEGGCSYVELSEGECVDGDACTVGDHCDAGVCVGLPVACDDGNPCTDDVCDGLGGCKAEFNTAACDDGDPCTVADACDGGECLGYAVDCKCETDDDCLAFDDGDACNGTLICDKSGLPYQCVVDPETIVVCPVPENQSICEQTVCVPETGACAAIPDHDGYACDDGSICSVGDVCLDGACVPGGNTLNCDDSNVCTDDTCDAVEGCLHAANAAACDDGNACTEGEACSGGKCQATTTVDCDDDNPCTGDSCLPASGCVHVIVAAGCDDGDPCTIGDSCVNGACVSGETLSCDDDNPCTADSCVAPGKCQFTPVAGACSDGNACTLDDHCDAGKCVANQTQKCDDDNVCTTDSCDPVQGCVHLLNTAPCDDGDVCTTGDSCQLGECGGAGTLTCNDSNPCTDDACAPEVGCVFTPNTLPCDDGSVCTENDACSAGSCQGGQVVSCDDSNVCTDDLCDFAKGCLHFNNSVVCNDANACTANEFCSGGVCGGGVPVVCNDENLCTDDSCAPETGCVFTDNELPCDDGDACTDGDVCGNGGCISGGALDCDDANVCTDDSCDSDSGCVHTNVQDETTCGQDVHCIAGECVDICNPQPGTKTFSMTKTIETFTVPDCIESITIEAWGAQGGRNKYCAQGGKGAHIKGTFSVTPGEALKVVVGERGLDWGYNAANQAGSGGGGSFIWRDSGTELLLVAAGGAGGGICEGAGTPTYAAGIGGTTGGCGTKDAHNQTLGGCNGADGDGGNGRGKGWNNVQIDPSGYSFERPGGYGGGGSVRSTHGGGGGGGYSGGAGGATYGGGGGGGSYNNGSNQSGEGNVKSEHGSVVISW